MYFRRQCFAGLLVGAAVLCVAPAFAAESLYRYRNADNVMVIDFSIPPEFAAKGYEIITPRGRVVEVVPPASEIASPDQRSLLIQQGREDKFILRSYSTVQDVMNARDRRLTLLRREIDILQGNIDEYQARRTTLREQAASFQASGAATPPAIEAVLADLGEQERNTQKMLSERQVQYRELVDKYDYYARRLVELKGGVAHGIDPVAKSGEKSPPPEPVTGTATPPLVR